MAITTLQAPATVTRPPSARGYRPATFSDALLSEWTKIRTLRSTFFTLAATVVFVLGLGALISYESSVHYGPGNGPWDPTSISLSGLVFGQLTIAVLGVLAITGEYSTGMIRTSLAAVPRRGRLLAAKAAVFGAVALVTGELVSWVAFFVGQLMISGHQPTASLSQPDVARAVIGGGLYIAVIGLMAVAAGTILRYTAAAITSVIAVLFVLPGVLEALPNSWRLPVEKYWPTGAGEQVVMVTRDANTLPAWLGFGELALFVAVLGALGYFLLQRRDAGGK
ncbi:MAG TPA: ABC transporter permease [Acidimicrobiales bacterium]|nr:ABC transporter permease [Acidimicrobiales bacterium]